jgi:hypothetical protein
MYTDRNEIRQLRPDLYHAVIPQTQFRTGICMSDHLMRKGAIYYYRRRVPADLLATYKRPEYVLSADQRRREAERLVRKVDVEVASCWIMQTNFMSM